MSKATNDLVDSFATALKEKLAAAEQKYGYDDTWREDDWRDELVEKLEEHVLKGDPRDVAAYCAFAWHHGWSIKPGHRAERASGPPPEHRLPSKANAHFQFRRKR